MQIKFATLDLYQDYLEGSSGYAAKVSGYTRQPNLKFGPTPGLSLGPKEDNPPADTGQSSVTSSVASEEAKPFHMLSKTAQERLRATYQGDRFGVAIGW
jgi:hypothetical protein